MFGTIISAVGGKLLNFTSFFGGAKPTILIVVFMSLIVGGFYTHNYLQLKSKDDAISKLQGEKAGLETQVQGYENTITRLRENNKNLSQQKQDIIDELAVLRTLEQESDERIKRIEKAIRNSKTNEDMKRAFSGPDAEKELERFNKNLMCEIQNYDKRGICEDGLWIQE